MIRIFKKADERLWSQIGKELTRRAVKQYTTRKRMPLSYEPSPTYLGQFWDPKKYINYGGYTSIHHVQAVVVKKGKRQRVHAIIPDTHNGAWRMRATLKWLVKDEVFFKKYGKGWRAVDPEILLQIIPYHHQPLRARLQGWRRRALAGLKVKPFTCTFDGKEITVLPPVVKRDNDRRLHCKNGPALRWSPDMKLKHSARLASVYAWHGTIVNPNIITTKVITDQMIEREWNTEQRRVLIERRFGSMAGFVIHHKLEPTHVDATGDLFHVGRGRQQLAYVRVKDPSTDREYWLRVPVTMQRAKQAVAWTYDINEDLYKPLAEA